MLNNINCKDFNEVLKQFKTYIKNEKQIQKIISAFHFAAAKHEGQLRQNGDPYLYHLLSTAYNLAQWHLDPESLQAGLLHDVLEDTPTSTDELIANFGTEVTNLVLAVTKVSHFAKERRKEIKADYLRKLYLSLAHDIRVIIIKMADRLHNIRTIEFLPLEKQKVIARETLEVYASIAHRLGMRELQQELEDCSFKILHPEEYLKIENLVKLDINKREKLVKNTIAAISNILATHVQLKFRICGRSKNIYSIYRKMYHFGKAFNNIHDILAIRIICKSIDDCYAILGYIHQQFIPIANRFKDYIATPKNNLYQSLHTAILYKNEIYELQIRTEAMEEIAVAGAAAHWRYKEGDKTTNKKKQQEIDEKLNIFQAILYLNTANVTDNDNKSIETKIKQDLFSELIYVLTPNGKVLTLPLGSTILDFAYKVHTEIGEKTVGARVNSTYCPLNTVLKTGDIVEIKTSKLAKPSYDWLNIAKTHFARQKIKKFLTKQQEAKSDETPKTKVIENEKKIAYVKEKIEQYIHENHLRWRIAAAATILSRLKFLKYQNYEDFCLAIANDEITIENAVTNILFSDSPQFKDLKTKKPINNVVSGDNDIVVENIPNIKTYLAQCCMPIFGEPIIGYITKGQGIKVHRKVCPNVINDNRKERTITTAWNNEAKTTFNYSVALKIYYLDRPGLLADIANILNQLKIPITSIDANNKLINGQGILKITIKVHNIDIFNQVITSIKKVPDIIEIIRIIM